MHNKFFIVLKYIFLGALLILLVFSIYLFFLNKTTKIIYIEQDKILKEESIKLLKYESCLMEFPSNPIILEKRQELNSFIVNNYPNTSIKYYDINSTMDYTYNEKEVYYAASLIKTIEALYTYDRALEDPSILDQTKVYTSNYIKVDSIEMKKRKLGEPITIRDLVKYSVNVSDNSAHFMLIDYIGINNLKEYGKSIGNDYTLIGGDTYGNINLNDAFNYMYKLNEYISKNELLGKELREAFDSDYYNYLTINDTNVLHKHGDHDMFFHDIGIVEDKNPYIVVVLTKYGFKDRETIIKDISSKIYEFHKYFNDKKQEICIK